MLYVHLSRHMCETGTAQTSSLTCITLIALLSLHLVPCHLISCHFRSGYGSESEQDDESSRVQLPHDLGRGNRAAHQSAIRLHEIGPRLSLLLVKVEEGLLGGPVMFHRFGERERGTRIGRGRVEGESRRRRNGRGFKA